MRACGKPFSDLYDIEPFLGSGLDRHVSTDAAGEDRPPRAQPGVVLGRGVLA
jgi:hypothetical protein